MLPLLDRKKMMSATIFIRCLIQSNRQSKPAAMLYPLVAVCEDHLHQSLTRHDPATGPVHSYK